MRDISKNKIYGQEYVNINGILQFLYHSGTSYDNPVMLFIHGGPGITESNYAYLMQEEWEKDYTIVHFDQRGSGKTLVENPENYPSMDDILNDTKEIVEYIKEKYKKDKVVIAGYSWGSIVGSLFIKKHPKDVLCYIGIGQVIDMMENERLLFKKLRYEFEKLGNRRNLRELKSIGEYPEKACSKTMRSKFDKVERLQRRSSLAGGKTLFMMKSFIKSPLFRLRDLKGFILSRKSNEKLVEFLMKFNLYDYSFNYEVPIFYILGENDWQVPTMISKKYFKEIQAPQKEIYIIKNAKHRPMFENKEEFDRVLKKINYAIKSKNS
ncbi:MAG: alpha/beta fold hydrolase [Sarcina sp.]